ncbi:MAG: hypothetical protein WC379_16125 [Methanoregula sp.]|jgi:hypothetical protein
MINIVLSQRTVDEFDQNKRSGIFRFPVAFLEAKSNFINNEKNPSFFEQRTLTEDDGIVVIRMPEQMYERLVNKVKDGKLSLPEDYFVRYYENRSDLNSHLKAVGDTLQVLPSEKYPLRKITEEINSEPESGNSESVITPSTVKSVLSYPQMFEERRYYDLINSGNDYDYCIGQITPNSWTLLGSALDSFSIYHEREYRFDSNEAIEIVAKYRDRNQGGDIMLFPALYKNGAEDPILSSQWDRWDGNIYVNANDIPHAYGYHVDIDGGNYYVALQDMVTDDWTYYIEAAAAGTSSFTELWGSSEYRQIEAPTTNTFSATTNPIVDEWAYLAGDDWQKPEDVWDYEDWYPDDFVRVTKAWSSSGDLITRSYVEYP